jgi:hypothetical protein
MHHTLNRGGFAELRPFRDGFAFVFALSWKKGVSQSSALPGEHGGRFTGTMLEAPVP